MAAAPQWLPQREGCIVFYKLSVRFMGDPRPQDSLQRLSIIFLPDVLSFVSLLEDGIYASGFYEDDERSWPRDELGPRRK